MASDKDKLRNTLHNQSKDLAKALKKNALPNKDTGYLDKTIKSTNYTILGDGHYAIHAEAVYYAKYLNAKTNFIEESIDEVVDTMANEIKEFEFNELMYRFEIQDINTNRKNRTKK